MWAVGQAFDGLEFQTLVERYHFSPSGQPPAVTAIAPASGPAAGGTSVNLTGTDFEAGAAVKIGGSDATGIVVNGASSIDAATPALTPGTLNDVVVTNPDSQTGTLLAGFFADFLDVSEGDAFHDFVEKLVRNGVTAGCGGGEYCRDTAVTRSRMSVFLLKAKLGPPTSRRRAPRRVRRCACAGRPSTRGSWLAGLGIPEGASRRLRSPAPRIR